MIVMAFAEYCCLATPRVVWVFNLSLYFEIWRL